MELDPDRASARKASERDLFDRSSVKLAQSRLVVNDLVAPHVDAVMAEAATARDQVCAERGLLNFE